MTARKPLLPVLERIAASGPEGITKTDLMDGCTEKDFLLTLEKLRKLGHKIIVRRFRDGPRSPYHLWVYYRCEEFAAVVDKQRKERKYAQSRERHRAKSPTLPRTKP